MYDLIEIFYNLTKQLYPTGRAFRVPDDSDKAKLQYGIAISEAKVFEDAKAVLDAILPDNDGFTEDDATDWERRLAMISNPLVSFDDRKKAIRRKMASPSVQDAHAHYLYVEAQLRSAGFDVYVYENRFPAYPSGYETETPFDIAAVISPVDALSLLEELQHKTSLQHGQARHGLKYNNIVVNSLDADEDSFFDLAGNLKCTFFIGGYPLGTFANVPVAREEEFRELILKSKQVQDVGFLFINYI